MRTFRTLITTFILTFTVTIANAADNAVKILDKTAAAFKSAGDVKVGFELSTSGGSTHGTLMLSGRKFQCSTGGSIAWFDGKTLWHYSKNNDEVNVTYPKAADLARMNPYSFISMYKSGYKCSMGKSTSTCFEVLMTGNNSTAYRTVVIQINKKTHQPTYIKLQTAKSSTEIRVNSFVKNQKHPASVFVFNSKEYPSAEIVDLR